MSEINEAFEAWASQRGLFRPSREGTRCTNYYDDFVACWQEAARQAMERAAKVCDERRATARKRADSGFGDREIELTATLEASCCADAIRALADVAGEKGVGNGEG